MLQLQSLLGLLVFPLLAWVLSENRTAYKSSQLVRLIGVGLLLQIVIAAAMLHIPVLRVGFDWATSLVLSLQNATLSGMKFVFGYVAGGPAPYQTVNPQFGFILAFQALPLILLISALTRLLYHWGILQIVVRGFSWALQRSLGVSGTVGTSAAANIFVGMIEAPLFVRPYLASMSRGALFAMMSVGMATIAGTVLALYAGVLSASLPGAAGHLIVASIISAPAAIMLAALMVPDLDSNPAEVPEQTISSDDRTHGSVDAIVKGTQEGILLLVNVTAMLIIFVALVALGNQILGAISEPFGFKLTIEGILGFAFAPLAWLTGIPANEAISAGSILGIKTVLNEFLAYIQLAKTSPEIISERSRLILSYALCGFANMGSLGIMIGGLITILPERKKEIVELGTKTLISGTFATLMTGCVVGLLTGW